MFKVTLQECNCGRESCLTNNIVNSAVALGDTFLAEKNKLEVAIDKSPFKGKNYEYDVFMHVLSQFLAMDTLCMDESEFTKFLLVLTKGVAASRNELLSTNTHIKAMHDVSKKMTPDMVHEGTPVFFHKDDKK